MQKSKMSPSAAFMSVLGSPSSRQYTFGDAVLAGWAEDGGMLWPTHIPRLSVSDLAGWSALTYPELVASVLKLFLPQDDPDMTHADVDRIVMSAFDSFGRSSVVELQTVSSSEADAASSLHIAELWHGPTLAFKDLGMSVLGRVLSHLLERRKERLTLLVGTSGDTGSSAIEAVRGLPNLQVVVLYPLQGFSSITAVQERQMTSVAEVEANVHVVGVEGSSDDLDVPMEACFRDAAFKRAHALGSVNSVNVIRLLVQAVHYFYTYLKLRPTADGTVQFAVPCGAGGHLAAGLLALRMGLPARLIASTNANDAMHRLLSTGTLRQGAHTQPTISPSMDIQMPYNVWRMLFVASGGSGAAVRAWQGDLARSHAVQLPEAVRAYTQQYVRSVSVGDGETAATIRHVRAASGYVLDPHTAVGVAAALRSPFGRRVDGAAEPIICMGCAHAVKFLPAVARALGCSMEEALRASCGEGTPPHRCVRAVADMAWRLQLGGEPSTAEKATPPGCTAVFRRADLAGWEAQLRRLVSSVAATDESGGASGRATGGTRRGSEVRSRL